MAPTLSDPAPASAVAVPSAYISSKVPGCVEALPIRIPTPVPAMTSVPRTSARA